MISHLSKSIALFFAKKNIISNDEVDSYIYGFQIMLSTMLNWSIIFLIMLYTGKYIVTILYVSSLLVLRHHTGGYHARTPMRCCMLSVFAYILVLLALTPNSSAGVMIFYAALLIMSFSCIIILAPMVHENNSVSNETVKHHRKFSVLLSLLLILTAVVLTLIQQNALARVLILTMFQVSVSLIIQKICGR